MTSRFLISNSVEEEEGEVRLELELQGACESVYPELKYLQISYPAEGHDGPGYKHCVRHTSYTCRCGTRYRGPRVLCICPLSSTGCRNCGIVGALALRYL